MKYKNLVDYVKENINTFEIEPLNKIDVLALTWLSYIHYPKEEKDLYNFKGVSIREFLKAEYFDEMFKLPIEPEQSKELFFNMCFSPRFRNITLSNYTVYTDRETNTQFSAITARINQDLLAVLYRGTDSTFIGWKEDFLMSLDKPIPSEILGKEYLENVLKQYDGKVIVSGHSKGGTIAVYSAVNNFKIIRDRLINIYNYDGPGFRKETLELPEFTSLKDKIVKVIPQGSMIGSLFNHENSPEIVFSRENGFWQHNPYSWEIVEKDFLYRKEVSSQSKLVYSSASELCEKLNDEDKIIVIDAIFDILQNSGATTFHGFPKVIMNNLSYFTNSIKSIDKETVKIILSVISNLASISFENIPETIFPKAENK